MPDNAATPMRHFVAYHNTEKMGRSLSEGDPFRVLSNRPLGRLLGHRVWFFVGEAATEPGRKRNYSLGSVFRVSDAGDVEDARFRHFASGPGHEFDPPPSVGELPWFADFLNHVGNFGLGVREVKDDGVVAGLESLAVAAGVRIE